MTELRLRPLRLEDEPAVLAAHEVMDAEDFTFALGYEPGMAWSAYVKMLSAWRCGVIPASDRPLVASTFLVADVGGEIVGRTSVRHELNEFLAHEGGHVGYAVIPHHRRRGYATTILRQSLIIARAEGIDRVLVTCDDRNVASATVIERCGGILESVVTNQQGHPTRRYWIT